MLKSFKYFFYTHKYIKTNKYNNCDYENYLRNIMHRKIKRIARHERIRKNFFIVTLGRPCILSYIIHVFLLSSIVVLNNGLMWTELFIENWHFICFNFDLYDCLCFLCGLQFLITIQELITVHNLYQSQGAAYLQFLTLIWIFYYYRLLMLTKQSVNYSLIRLVTSIANADEAIDVLLC